MSNLENKKEERKQMYSRKCSSLYMLPLNKIRYFGRSFIMSKINLKLWTLYYRIQTRRKIDFVMLFFHVLTKIYGENLINRIFLLVHERILSAHFDSCAAFLFF